MCWCSIFKYLACEGAFLFLVSWDKMKILQRMRSEWKYAINFNFFLRIIDSLLEKTFDFFIKGSEGFSRYAIGICIFNKVQFQIFAPFSYWVCYIVIHTQSHIHIHIQSLALTPTQWFYMRNQCKKYNKSKKYCIKNTNWKQKIMSFRYWYSCEIYSWAYICMCVRMCGCYLHYYKHTCVHICMPGMPKTISYYISYTLFVCLLCCSDFFMILLPSFLF